MDNRPRRVLQRIVREYGRGVLQDPRRCRALLMDYCGECRGEINLLALALQEGVPEDLASPTPNVPWGLTVARLVQGLRDNYFLPESAARWAVEACAAALDPRRVTVLEEGRRFRSRLRTQIAARAWLAADRSWHLLGETPGEVDLPTDRELRISARVDDDAGEQLAKDLEAAGGVHRLDLAYSTLTDRGAAALMRLRDVQHVGLSRTSAALVEVSTEAAADSLRGLVLWGSDGITDASLRTIGELTALERLELGRCRGISDAGLPELASLRRLAYLGLSATPVTDEGLQVLQSLPALRHLDLSVTRITGEGLRSLAGNAGLVTLDVASCVNLRPSALAVLQELPGLADLRLARCGLLSDESMAYVRARQGLASLSLEGLSVTDTGVLYLLDLEGLSTLNASWTAIGDAGVARLSGMRGLRELGLAGTRVTDAGLAHLTRLPMLQALDLADTEISDPGLRALGTLVTLRSLDLEGTAITDAGLVHLGALPRLRRVYLGNTGIGDLGLGLLSRVTNLEVADVAMCSGVTAAGVNALEAAGVRVNRWGAGLRTDLGARGPRRTQ